MVTFGCRLLYRFEDERTEEAVALELLERRVWSGRGLLLGDALSEPACDTSTTRVLRLVEALGARSALSSITTRHAMRRVGARPWVRPRTVVMVREGAPVGVGVAARAVVESRGGNLGELARLGREDHPPRERLELGEQRVQREWA
jgi:hypothetical protein